MRYSKRIWGGQMSSGCEKLINKKNKDIMSQTKRLYRYHTRWCLNSIFDHVKNVFNDSQMCLLILYQ